MIPLDLIDNYLKEKKAFNLTINSKNIVEVQPLSFSQGIYYWASRSYQQKSWKDNAGILAIYLQTMNRLENPKTAMQDPSIILVRKFLKFVPKNLSKETNVVACQKELLAARLAISSFVLDQNPGFQKFVEKSRLYNYLEKYNHSLSVNSNNNEIFILRKNSYVSWNSISMEFKTFPIPGVLPYQAWKYGRNGLKNKNLYEWDKLKPFLVEDPATWGHRYRISLCTTTIERPRTSAGDHSYIRLYNGETGAIYSFGLYRPDKALDSNPKKNPLRVKPGYIMLPDASEFWSVPIQEITAEISKDQYEKIKTQVESDKRREIHHIPSEIKRDNVLTFQLMEDNCTAFVTRIASLAGIYIPVETTIYHIILPHKIMRVVDTTAEHLPELCLKVNRAFFGFFGNLIELWYGASVVDNAVLAEANARPSIKAWSAEIFNPRKMINHSPFVLGQITCKKVENWRLCESEKLNHQLKGTEPNSEAYKIVENQIEALKYQLPAEYLKK